ncbi:hypothetical protein NSA02_06430 [Ligilactobacillus murinus]|jgi:hypothetical protein|uniref:hypothetical protein n=1 Tax=Ligilactobacillus murinus TaxID=1622 RepID=UPI00214ACC7C|nr:hypothetical protein [Ligilactobacillus murinus]MCR1889594.1 hypothetical protein [Ligilactobacillus murinus]MCR1896444.1 hypothetical protein [Ligilactobacillus murinus]MDE7024215.1 hypothetical protein [Ligilactobacillus sp.]
MELEKPKQLLHIQANVESVSELKELLSEVAVLDEKYDLSLTITYQSVVACDFLKH